MTHTANLSDLMPEGEPPSAAQLRANSRDKIEQLERELAQANRDKAALLEAGKRLLSAGYDLSVKLLPKLVSEEFAAASNDAADLLKQAEAKP